MRVFANTHDDVDLTSGLLLDVVVDFADFVEGDFVFAGSRNDEKEDVAGAFDVVVVE